MDHEIAVDKKDKQILQLKTLMARFKQVQCTYVYTSDSTCIALCGVLHSQLVSFLDLCRRIACVGTKGTHSQSNVPSAGLS